VTSVGGALATLGGEHSEGNLEVYGHTGLDAQCVATHLMLLSSRLQTVAASLAPLADHADLTELAASLRPGGKIVARQVTDEDTTREPLGGKTVTRQVTDEDTTHESLEGKTTEELLDMLDDPTITQVRTPGTDPGPHPVDTTRSTGGGGA
jgi:hypothetical protein